MAKRITRFEPWQTAKTMAGLYFLLGLIAAVLMLLVPAGTFEAVGEQKPGMGMIIAMPIAYAIGALIFVPIGCWLYNLVAARLGGIEVTVTDTAR